LDAISPRESAEGSSSRRWTSAAVRVFSDIAATIAEPR
jgi:hypothetical protein